ncbi:MAG: class I SAM-dependent methyltransferase [Actinomycetota bacterium]
MDIPDTLQCLATRLNACVDALPAGSGLKTVVAVQAALRVGIALEDVARAQDEDPVPPLTAALSAAIAAAEAAVGSAAHVEPGRGWDPAAAGQAYTTDLFENAWTTYSPSTYDHSVGLVEGRLRANGFDDAWFAGKTCLDSGCGTGRLSLAMARFGAARVVALDLGRRSLDFFGEVLRRHGIDTVEPTEGDVTDLGRFADESFDFVASNGVLHHTRDPLGGLVEHFRVTRRGGVLWLYLYGAGGLYWGLYDALRPLVAGVPPQAFAATLRGFGVREGLVYTLLDNFQAPRTYHTVDQVRELLEPHGRLRIVTHKGNSPVDDTAAVLASRHGRAIFGPGGEVRISVFKDS